MEPIVDRPARGKGAGDHDQHHAQQPLRVEEDCVEPALEGIAGERLPSLELDRAQGDRAQDWRAPNRHAFDKFSQQLLTATRDPIPPSSHTSLCSKGLPVIIRGLSRLATTNCSNPGDQSLLQEKLIRARRQPWREAGRLDRW